MMMFRGCIKYLDIKNIYGAFKVHRPHQIWRYKVDPENGGLKRWAYILETEVSRARVQFSSFRGYEIKFVDDLSGLEMIGADHI